MKSEDILKGKRILVVDDEPDILETIVEMLAMCAVDTAASFYRATELLNSNAYDYVILDIMGIRGYDLLQAARRRGMPALMLTAHALDKKNFMRSIEQGAAAYIPKESLPELPELLADLIRSQQEGEKGANRWFKKLEPFFNRQFGPGWREDPKDFWNSYLWLLSDE